MNRPPLREFQRRALEALLRPEGAHVLVIAPTGSGKSRIYEELAAAAGLRVLLITPLVALARQQKERLAALGVSESRVRVLSPESLRNPRRLAELARWRPEALAVDECHCLWDWGERFRPAFLEIPPLVEKFRIRRSVWMTATLPPEARADLMARIEVPWMEIGSFGLPETLHLSASRVSWPAREREGLAWVREQDGAGLIFVSTREGAERLARLFRALGWRAAPFHAGLAQEEKTSTLESLASGELQLLVTTSAFGMGMDLPRLLWVLLWQAPPSLLALAQFVGRVGRDPKCTARGHILWDFTDFHAHRELLRADPRAESQSREVERFLKSIQCRRAALQNSFHPAEQSVANSCGDRCDVCLSRKTGLT